VLKVWVGGHGRRVGTYFHGWTKSSHFLGQCIHCDQLILRKISKIGVTRGQILRLNTPNSISAGLRPRPRWGSLQCFSDPLAVFKGPTSKGREEKRGVEGKERRREGGGKEEEGRGGLPPIGESGCGSGGREGRGEGQGGELGLGRPGTSFFPL